MQADRFTIKSQEALEAAQRLAAERRNPQTRPEHLLAVLLEQEGGVVVPGAAQARRRPGGRARDPQPGARGAAAPDRLDPARPTGPSNELIEVLRGAEEEMRALDDSYISTEHLVLALAKSRARPATCCARSARLRALLKAAARGPRWPEGHRPEPRGQVPGAREVRPRPHPRRRRTASSTR